MFFDSAAEARLQAVLGKARRCHPLTPLIAWQARVVAWLAGNCAATRFLSATTSLLNAYPKVPSREQVRGFQRAIIVWKLRSEQEQVRNLLGEITEHIQRLPPDVVRLGKFPARLRSRTFQAHCDLLLERCSQLLDQEQRCCWHILPAALAALAACDGSAVALPQRYLQAGAQGEQFALLARTIKKIAEQIDQPGYDALLGAIDVLPESSHEFDFGQLRDLLSQGNSVADAVWACEQEILPSLSDSCLRIPAVRRLSEAFANCGCPLSSANLTQSAMRYGAGARSAWPGVQVASC